MSAQLYTSHLGHGDGHLNDEQVSLVKRFVEDKWDGTEGHFKKLFQGEL